MKVILSLTGALAIAGGGCGGSDLPERQSDVARAGGAVMPFDLERTTHVFDSREAGGLQSVLSDDGDPGQIALIRTHLAEEAKRFGGGDFHDPAMIHGDDMPGLHALATGHEKLTVVYREVERGAQIEYTSQDPKLIEAIHLWFTAQLRDHGEHAKAHTGGGA